MEAKSYLIGGQEYTQRPIVLAQFRVLMPLIEGLEWGGDKTAWAAARDLGDRLPEALAAVIVEKDLDVRQALDDLEARARDLECRIAPDLILEVIEDFFDCNRASSLLARIAEAMAKLMTMDETPSRGSSSPSPKATSKKGRRSSGKPKRA